MLNSIYITIYSMLKKMAHGILRMLCLIRNLYILQELTRDERITKHCAGINISVNKARFYIKKTNSIKKYFKNSSFPPATYKIKIRIFFVAWNDKKFSQILTQNSYHKC